MRAAIYDLIAALSVALGSDLARGDYYDAALQRLAAREGLYGTALKANCLREARIEAIDFPPLSALARFRVTRADTNRAWRWAGDARAYVEAVRGIVPLAEWELDAWREDISFRYRAWYVLDDAVIYSQAGMVFHARRSLHRLRDLLGVEAFARGWMPEPVPLGMGFPPYRSAPP